MFVRTYNQLIEVLILMKNNLPGFATEVGATAADITWVDETLANLIYVRDYCATYDANKKSAFDIKGSYFNGPEGSLVSDFATTAAAVVPNPPLTGGVLFTFREMAARFKLGPGYTEEIGIALGIAGGEESPEPEPELDFDVETKAAFQVEVTFKKKGMDAVRFEFRYKGGEWQNAATVLESPGTFAIAPQVAGVAEQVELRGIYLKGNDEIGSFSATKTAFIAP